MVDTVARVRQLKEEKSKLFYAKVYLKTAKAMLAINKSKMDAAYIEGNKELSDLWADEVEKLNKDIKETKDIIKATEQFIAQLCI